MQGQALLNLADIATCISGDFHSMHLNYQGIQFDMMHGTVLKKYYEEAADDADTWAEAALLFSDAPVIPNQNGAAVRISWQSCEGKCNLISATARIEEILTAYMEACVILFNSLNKSIDCSKCVGVANTLQTRIEYWSKELYYFNKRRVE